MSAAIASGVDNIAKARIAAQRQDRTAMQCSSLLSSVPIVGSSGCTGLGRLLLFSCTRSDFGLAFRGFAGVSIHRREAIILQRWIQEQ
jgi:hypothetical protein